MLHKKLSRALAGDPPDMAQVRACAVQLNELNEGMLRRMDELYRTVKNNSIALTAVPVEGLVEAAVGAVSRQVPRPAGSPGCGYRPISAGGSQPPERGGVQPAVQWV